MKELSKKPEKKDKSSAKAAPKPAAKKASVKAEEEITNIFAALEKQEEPKAEIHRPSTDEKPAKRRKKVADKWADPKGTNSGGRKYVDGLAVYTEEELGLVSRGGSTPQCPFDCDCCV